MLNLHMYYITLFIICQDVFLFFLLEFFDIFNEVLTNAVKLKYIWYIKQNLRPAFGHGSVNYDCQKNCFPLAKKFILCYNKFV